MSISKKTTKNKKTFTKYDNELMDIVMGKVKPSSVCVFLQLVRHANRKTKETFVSNERIAEILECSVSTIERAITELSKEGYIIRRKRKYASSITTVVMSTEDIGNLDIKEVVSRKPKKIKKSIL